MEKGQRYYECDFGSRRVSAGMEPTMKPHPHPSEKKASVRLHHCALFFFGSLSAMDSRPGWMGL